MGETDELTIPDGGALLKELGNFPCTLARSGNIAAWKGDERSFKIPSRWWKLGIRWTSCNVGVGSGSEPNGPPKLMSTSLYITRLELLSGIRLVMGLSSLEPKAAEGACPLDCICRISSIPAGEVRALRCCDTCAMAESRTNGVEVPGLLGLGFEALVRPKTWGVLVSTEDTPADSQLGA